MCREIFSRCPKRYPNLRSANQEDLRQAALSGEAERFDCRSTGPGGVAVQHDVDWYVLLLSAVNGDRRCFPSHAARRDIQNSEAPIRKTYVSPPCLAKLSASIAAPRAPAVSPFGMM